MNSLKENIEILDLHVKVTGFCVVQTKLVKRLLQQRGHEVLQNYTVKHWSKNWIKLYQIYFKISYMICNAVKKKSKYLRHIETWSFSYSFIQNFSFKWGWYTVIVKQLLFNMCEKFLQGSREPRGDYFLPQTIILIWLF